MAASKADLLIRRVRGRGRAPEQGGQGLVEFSALVPVFLLLLFGMLEFGFVFDQNLTLEYATREGARVGAALANDGGVLCVPATTTVDAQIVAAVQRVLLSPGSRVTPEANMQVLIWKADASGAPISGTTNTWKFTGLGTGKDRNGQPAVVDGQQIAFTEVTQSWNACTRNNGTPVDSIGVSTTHGYSFQTPLAGILRFFGGASAGTLTMSDRTVMALNPTN